MRIVLVVTKRTRETNDSIVPFFPLFSSFSVKRFFFRGQKKIIILTSITFRMSLQNGRRRQRRSSFSSKEEEGEEEEKKTSNIKNKKKRDLTRLAAETRRRREEFSQNSVRWAREEKERVLKKVKERREENERKTELFLPWRRKRREIMVGRKSACEANSLNAEGEEKEGEDEEEEEDFGLVVPRHSEPNLSLIHI